jgi:hypothetical protein
MSRNVLKLTGLLAFVVVLILATGCDEGASVGDLQTESQTVDLGDSESVNVEVEIGAGELDVSGGASELLEATFTYNVDELNPEATYSDGKLIVNHDDIKEGIGTFFDLDDYRNEWDLRFNEGVSMEMRIEVGAGRTALTIGSLELTDLDIDTGAGEVNLDLSGSQFLTRLEIDMGAGEITLDLTGDWQDDLEAVIQGGVGQLNLRLPREVGVIVEVDGGIGGVDTSGLTKSGSTYTNDAYGESGVTLRIDIDGGVGQINLDVS